MIILGRNVFSSFDDLKLIQDNEIQSIINMMGDYKPRLIIFAFMKQIIYDFYNYVQVIQDDLNSSMKNFSSFSAEKSS